MVAAPIQWGLLLAGTVFFGIGCGRTALGSRGDSASHDHLRDDSGAAPDNTGGLRLVAGHLGGPGWVDGVGDAARFARPTGITSDGAGHLFVVDNDSTIRKVVIATGEVTTLAGSPGREGSTDGAGAAASFNAPMGIASDGAGNLFVADTYNSTIRKVVVATGEVTTIAGSARERESRDGAGAAARFSYPMGIASDGIGRLFVADSDNHTIRSVDVATGVVTTLAGSPRQLGSADGTGGAARFNTPTGVLTDRAGRLFVVDAQNRTIRQVVIATGKVTTLARLLETAPRFDKPLGLAGDGTGNLFVAIAGEGGSVIQRVVIATGAVTTFAGSPGQYGNSDGTGSSARFAEASGVASDGAGNLYVADTFNHTIRKAVIATGAVTTFAGSPGQKGSRDGVGTAAGFDYLRSIASSGTGELFVADSNTIRKVVIATGAVTTIAGSTERRGHTDGTGAAASFNHPADVASDGAGNLFVADTENYTIRKVVVATGEVTTLAGFPGLQAGSRDGTGADARLAQPKGMACDQAGNLFVSDGSAIRRVMIATGEVTTLAGSPQSSGSADGVGAEARFTTPMGVVSDGADTLFVADWGNHTIRKVVVSTQTVTTVVGSPDLSGVVLGALPARLATPCGLALGPGGELFVSDIGENVILAVRF